MSFYDLLDIINKFIRDRREGGGLATISFKITQGDGGDKNARKCIT